MLQAGSEPFGECLCFRGRGDLVYNRKLVAAEASHEVSRGGAGQDSSGGCTEERVTGFMSHCVVHHFESVQIYEEDGNTILFVNELFAKRSNKLSPVRKAGKGVDVGGAL